MNPLRRALGLFAASTDSTALILRSYSSSATRRRSKSVPTPPPTTAAAAPEIPRPAEIPYQPKVANAVNLIGQVRMAVQFQTCPDGKTYAATVITRQESHSSPFLWIPVIFEGDLAHSAACHLKENDFIYVSGQLSTDPPRLGENQAQSSNNIQVIVQSLNFVQGYPQLENTSATSKQEKAWSSFEKDKISKPEQHMHIRDQVNVRQDSNYVEGSSMHASKSFLEITFPYTGGSNTASDKLDIDPSRKDIHSYQSDEEDDIDKSWKDLLSHPVEWWDVRSTKENPKGAAFERKSNGELLFINSSTPKWLQNELDSMTIDLKPELKHSTTDVKAGPDSWFSSWTDLLDNSKQWSDFRDKKLKGLVKPRHPDFKRKDGSVSLWLNQAPEWVLSKLKGVEFDVPFVKSKQTKDAKGVQSWNDLVKNPDKWWDNRSNKRNVKAPDFKHKETGEGLWLNDSPSWVSSKLPPIKPKQSEGFGRKQTLVS